MNILIWVVFGGLAGWVASLIVVEDGNMGIFANIVVGIAGAFIGGWLSDVVGLGTNPGPGAERPSTFLSFIWAVVGACILLAAFRLIW